MLPGRLPSWLFASFILASADVDCHRDMHVGYVVTIHNSHVILYRILGNRINNLGSCIYIPRQICQFPAPVVRCRDSLNLISQLCAIRKQTNRNATWTLAILVIRIVPDLASFETILLVVSGVCVLVTL